MRCQVWKGDRALNEMPSLEGNRALNEMSSLEG